MAIESSIFGGVTLTGEDAEAFEEQFVKNPVKENKLAQAALNRGMTRFTEYKEKGYITIKTDEDSHS